MPEDTELVTDTARMQALCYLKTRPRLFPALGVWTGWGRVFIIRERHPPPYPLELGGGLKSLRDCLSIGTAFSALETGKPVPLGPAAAHTGLFLPSTSVTSLHLPALERPSGQSGCPRKSFYPEATVYALLPPAAVSR